MPRVCIVYRSEELWFDAPDGSSILDVAREHSIPIEGLCGGEMDCSTCHVVVPAAWYERLPPPVEAEEDMLDLLPTCKPTSRLGCQIHLSSALDGLVVEIAQD